jgi:hypothetical protein
MKTPSLLNKGICGLILAAAMLLASTNPSEAKSKIIVGGVTVSFSGNGLLAYYYEPDGTLSIEVPAQTGGSLTITVGSTAYLSWGNFVDIYLLADFASLKSITVKGHATCTPFVVGQVGFVNKFALSKGVIGGTDYYGVDFGLGMVSPFIPSAISLKQSYTTAQLFGYPYEYVRPANAGRAAGSADAAATGEAVIHKREASPEKAALIRRIQGPVK